MEELSILVVLKVDVELLVPHNTPGAQDVHELEKKRVSHQIIHQGYGTNETGVCPFVRIWMRYIESSDGGVDDLIRRLGHGTLDFFLVCRCKYTHAVVVGYLT